MRLTSSPPWISSSLDREPGAQAVAASGAGAGLELAAVDRHALAHADQAVSALVAVAAAETVVAHGQLDLPVAVPDEHLGVLRPSVLEGVRQALLDEPVSGEVDAGR